MRHGVSWDEHESVQKYASRVVAPHQVMDSKFRDGFDKPQAMVPNQPTAINFEMPDVYHTFRRGHRVMVQVQSSWFPLVDRNPQKFVPSIYKATAEDFVSATQRIYCSPELASHIVLPVMP